MSMSIVRENDSYGCWPCLYSLGLPSKGSDDVCLICFTEPLSAAPVIFLGCNHIFHLDCCRTFLSKRWFGPRITFGFCQCPICKAHMVHDDLSDLLSPINLLMRDVRRKALTRLQYEKQDKCEAITLKGSPFYSDPAGFAMHHYAYYLCHKCGKAYFGGEARCDLEAEFDPDYDPKELICGACLGGPREQNCLKHGTEFLEYKCRYCCSIAVWFCLGSTHFCNLCHSDHVRITRMSRASFPKCPVGPGCVQLGGKECPLRLKHPPTGDEFSLGCGACRNALTF